MIKLQSNRLESEREVVFQEIMTKFPELTKNMSLQIENSFQVLNRINKIKSMFRYVEVKLWSIQEKEKNCTRKQTTHHKEMESRSTLKY